MNKISQDGVDVILDSDRITVNGVEHLLPESVKRSKSHLTVKGGRITVNGFVFNPETGEFSRDIPWFLIAALAAILYLIFG